MTSAPEQPSWSKAATHTWENYARKLRRHLQNSEADAEEVIGDLKQHIQEEQRERKISILSELEMRGFLDRFGLPEIKAEKALGPFRQFMLIFTVLVVPYLALLDEALFRDASLIYKNLFPHPLLFALAWVVPLQKSWFFWKKKQQGVPIERASDRFLNGFSLIVSGWFSLLLLPMMVLGSLGAFLFFWTIIGLTGFLMLSPLFCFAHSLYNALKYRTHETAFQKYTFFGMLSAIVLGLLAYSLVGIQERSLRAAIEASSVEERNAAIQQLRHRFSDRQLSMRLFGPGSHTEPFPFWGHQGTQLRGAERKQLLYAVTGSVIPKISRTRYGLLAYGMDGLFLADWDWDPRWARDRDLGGTEVGKPQEHVRMLSSRMDASVHQEGRVSYTEWTLEFENTDSFAQAEARCLIKLPPDAVVSRATLWIQGEPKEAAFGGTAQVRQAYEQVVRRRRDPLLVTQKGVDSILAQCFPILPNSSMKIRIGVTTPLISWDPQETSIPLPFLAASNLGNAEQLPDTQIWVESHRPFLHDTERVQQEQDSGKELYVFNQSVATPQGARLETKLSFRHQGAPDAAWAASTKDTAPSYVLQRWQPSSEDQGKLILLIDRSNDMREHEELIRDLLTQLPEQVSSVVFSGFPAEQSSPEEASSLFTRDSIWGGPDPSSALLLAYQEAAKHQADRILWLHANTPILLNQEHLLEQYSERRPVLTDVLSIPLSDGDHAIESLLQGPFRYRSRTEGQSLSTEAFSQLIRGKGWYPIWQPIREVIAEPPPDTVQSSDHLIRLWAYDQIRAGSNDSKQVQELMKLGVQQQLVTPLTGAVVLENQAQYKQNNLDDVDADTVPSIPEPETALLLMVFLAVLAWLRLRRNPCPA